ncbi:MAG: hypothetical protein ABI624_04215, partial [Casimicrobiaceae bacterium]
NVQVNGNALVSMPSAWPGGSTLPPNNPPVLQGATRAAGVPDPAYGGGSMIVQATGTLALVGTPTNDFVFPGGVVLKAGGALNLNSVVIDNGWTTTGKPYQGLFIESPTILNSGGNIQMLTNNLNWMNFSTFPNAPVRTWTLVPLPDSSSGYVTADAVAPHLNIYSLIVETAAAGQCVPCVSNPLPVNMF